MHHLVQSGFKRSELVKAYAYCVIHLSVAVKGILEAVYASQVS